MTILGLTVLSIFAGTLAGTLALALVFWFAPRPRQFVFRAPEDTLAEPRQFVFRNGYLVDHSDNVGFLVSMPVDYLKAWDELIDTLAEIADGVETAFEDLRDNGRPFRIEGVYGKDRIHTIGVREGEDLRITVASSAKEQSSVRVDIKTLNALERDLDLLNGSSDKTPSLSWTVDGEGRVIWANAAYLELAAACNGPDAARGWPLAILFPDEGHAPPRSSRRQVTDAKGRVRWYEVSAQPLNDHGSRHMHALSLDTVIAAEDSLRTFIQTLAKTFAHLPTGLAIFDQDRTLAMFNPALMDMTGLDGSWLSRRPKLEDFFDALRDHSKLPEPRDYKAWRDGLSDVSRVDDCGTYHETWTLPNGQTFCVTGRPQADGAVALMMEDISEDVSTTRAQRRERDALVLGIAALDTPTVVFGPDGQRLAISDSAVELFETSDETPLPETLDACISHWRDRFQPSPAWGDLRSFAKGDAGVLDTAEWSEPLRRPDGPEIEFRIIPTRGGGLTLTFREEPHMPHPAAQSQAVEAVT